MPAGSHGIIYGGSICRAANRHRKTDPIDPSGRNGGDRNVPSVITYNLR